MSLWSRFYNALRNRQLSREIDEELDSHLAEAAENGRDPEEARRAFGSMLRVGEQSYEIRVLPRLDSLRADTIFGWRQLRKHKIASVAAILSLGLAIGASISAFRLIDALLLQPLPIAEPERLYAMFTRGYDPGGHFRLGDSNEYPQFRAMRAAVKNDAELIATSFGERIDLTYGSEAEIEKAHRQFVSGWMFDSFGLKPALGRLFTESDDDKPRTHPYAVLSYDYWTRRFGRDPKILGRSFRMDNDLYQIVGIAPRGFSGSEPGTMTDIFLPTMMYAGATREDWSWVRTFVYMRPQGSVTAVRDRLQAVFHAVQTERAKSFVGWPKRRLDNFLSQTILVLPASGGLSYTRQEYSRPLQVLTVLVGLVLLIACANVANLLTGQAAGRSREMALRVSIGAGRGRLTQLALVESTLLAVLASAVGTAFAWWSAPYVVEHINPADDPTRLALPADWRVLGFGLALTIGVTFLFGLFPALRALAMQPVSALKGSDTENGRPRLMHGLISVQVAFSCIVLFLAGLLLKSFDRLENQPTGFSSERLLALDVEAQPRQAPVFWNQVAEHLQEVPGVERVAIAGWPLLSGVGANGFVSVNGTPASDRLAYFLNVSPHWLDTMSIPLVDGRDFEPDDVDPGAAIVNETFAKEYFGGANPLGRWFARGTIRLQVVGLVRDARYRNMRETIAPTAYVPFRSGGEEPVNSATFMVRTVGENPLALAGMLRREVPRARPEFRVSNIRTQLEINRSQTIRERLLATLALFFAVAALLLAGIGLYAVLDYSVLQRQREIGIRIAVGAPPGRVASTVVSAILVMVSGGALCGIGLGLPAAEYAQSLLYEVKPTETDVLMGVIFTILGITALAAIAPVARAVRIDPMTVLKVE
jgi:predicted permease